MLLLKQKTMGNTIEVVTKIHLKQNGESAQVDKVEFNLVIGESIDSTPYLTEDENLTETGVKLITEILTRGLAANLHGHADQFPMTEHIVMIDKVLTKAIQDYEDGVIPLAPGQESSN